MTRCHKRRVNILILASVLLGDSFFANSQVTPPFVIAISLPTPTMHVGDDLVIEETVSNPTDHVVFIGNGPGVGSTVELLNEKGEDLGYRAMGVTSKPNNDQSMFVIHSGKLSLRPGSARKATWRYKPEAENLSPGTYKLRTHVRDMTSKTEVYSNTVVLTVLR